MLTSIDPRLKAPSHHHWPTDRLDALECGSVAGAVALTRALVARLGEP